VLPETYIPVTPISTSTPTKGGERLESDGRTKQSKGKKDTDTHSGQQAYKKPPKGQSKPNPNTRPERTARRIKNKPID